MCGLLDAYDALATLVPTGGRLLLTGGGARSAAYRQVLADLAGREITVPEVEEAVATGACVQAAAVLLQREPADVAGEWSLRDGVTGRTGPWRDGLGRGARRATTPAAIGRPECGGSTVRRSTRSRCSAFPRSADADALRSARRRLALDLHPDRGGSADRMQAINVAFEEAMGLLAGAGGRGPVGSLAASGARRRPRRRAAQPSVGGRRSGSSGTSRPS